MAGRLTKSQKKEMSDAYCKGESMTDLALQFGCSLNTVSRTIKSILSKDEYESIKSSRSPGKASKKVETKNQPVELKSNEKDKTSKKESREKNSSINSKSNKNDLGSAEENDYELNEEESSHLALDDADDFGDDSIDDKDESIETNSDSDDFSLIAFREVVPLETNFDFYEQKNISSQPFKPGILPEVVYMLVDKSVELDVRQVKDFPEWSFLPESDQERKAIYLFGNQRSAKRNCSRNQRVIKIPDSSVFEVSSTYLLSRGITRLVMEDSMIALDSAEQI